MQNLVTKIKMFELSPEDLSIKSGILLDHLWDILHGSIEPSLQEVRKIAKVLRVSPDFLLNDAKQIPSLEILYRKNAAISERNSTEKLSYIISNSIELLDGKYIPDEKLDQFIEVESTLEGAMKLAEDFRKKLFNSDFHSPITNLAEIVIRELNCIFLIYEIGNKRDGASVIVNGIPFIIISPRFEPRMLFTLAHELGHILAHHKDKNYAIVDDNTVNSSNHKNDEEAFAHAFASELLMPREGVGIALKTIRRILNIQGNFVGDVELLYLCRIYGVSFEVAALRCENLGIVPIGAAASIYESISREHKNPENRARQLNLPERPIITFPKISSNLLKPTIEKIATGEISLEKASELLQISVVDIINYNSQINGYSS